MVIDSLAATGRGIYPSGFARQVSEGIGPSRESVRKRAGAFDPLQTDTGPDDQLPDRISGFRSGIRTTKT